jgi:hypothetical protein
MSSLVFQATLGGQVNLNGPNTASTFDIAVPATTGTMVTTGDSGTVTNTMLAGSIANAKLTNSSVTVGSTSIALGATSTTLDGVNVGATTPGTGAFTTLSASSTVSGAGFSTYLASPPAIGGTAAAAGTFTILSGTTSVTTPIVKSASSLTLQSNGTTTAVTIDTNQIMLLGATSARTTQAKIELTSAANTALSFYMYKTSQVEMAMGFKSSTDSNFYIGTGSSSVGTYGVYLTNTGNSWSAVSDERMKTIIEPIQNASAKVATLRTVMGYYSADTTQTRRPFLIAQDVQAVLPEAVNVQNVETGTLGMSYTDTIPLLVAAIKEQQELITSLTVRVAALEAK